MNSGLLQFVHRDSVAPEGAKSATTAQDHVVHREDDRTQQPSRPETAQRIYGDQKHPEYNNAYDTDAESFDETHPTLNDGDYMVSNVQQGQSIYGDEDDQSRSGEDGDESEHAAEPDQFNNDPVQLLKSQMKQQKNQHIVLEELPDSYPSTTSGEPEIEYEPEAHYREVPVWNSQRRNHAANASQPREVRATANPRQQPLKMASIVNPPMAVHQHRDTYQRPQKASNVIPRDILKPPPVLTQVPRQPPADLALAARQKPNPREFRIQQQTVSTLLGQGQSHVDAKEAHEIHEDELDYGLEELYKKDFASLQADPFDGPPPENSNDAPSKSAPQSLEQKLAAAAKQSPGSQKDFFASLDINEWDEAGDWFQERFSDILNRLRQARKQKRNLSRKFEDEVQQREQALVRKRKITEEAMNEMKMSGAAVLQNTPKKKQKHSR